MTRIWYVSRGTGGFKATHESVQARGEPGDWEVVFTTPIGVHYLQEQIDDRDDAIHRARLEAQRRDFDAADIEDAGR